jgi:hypothetical protein
MSESANAELYKHLVEAYRNRDKFFGNARMVNSLIDEFKMNLGLRVMKVKDPKKINHRKLKHHRKRRCT